MLFISNFTFLLPVIIVVNTSAYTFNDLSIFYQSFVIRLVHVHDIQNQLFVSLNCKV